jgi:hypothetical protein
MIAADICFQTYFKAVKLYILGLEHTQYGLILKDCLKIYRKFFKNIAMVGLHEGIFFLILLKIGEYLSVGRDMQPIC